MEQDAPWDEIARAYRDLSTPVAEIRERYGLTYGQLRQAVRDRGWPTRDAMRKKAKAPCAPRRATRQKAPAAPEGEKSPSVAAPPATPPGTGKAIKPLGLVKRIYNTIDKELSKLEEHAGKSSQDRERASRALSQMVSSLEKAVEMQREITREQSRKDTSGKGKEALKHAEELRREIADRIERLQRKRASAG